MGARFSRRSFVKRAGLLGAVLAGGGVSTGTATARRSRNDLSLERERTYRALVATVATGGAGAAYADRVTTDFRAWYRTSLPHVRAAADATLDSLARRSPGRFRGLARSRRVRLLRDPAVAPVSAQAVALARLPTAADGRCAPGAA